MRKSKKRRGRGEGAIYQRESDGRWTANVTVGYRPAADDPTKLIRIRKVVYGDTKAEVQQRLSELLEQKGAVVPGDTPSTLKGGMDFWLDCNVKPTVDPATYALHKQRTAAYIWPHLARTPSPASPPLWSKTGSTAWRSKVAPRTSATSAASCYAATSTSVYATVASSRTPPATAG